MVSIAKLHKAENSLKNFKDRYEILRNILTCKIKTTEKADTPLIVKKSNERKIAYILVSSNKGLCGAFNKNIFRLLKNIKKKKDTVFVIGKKGITFVRKEQISAKKQYLFPDRENFYKFSNNLVLDILDNLKLKDIDTIKVIFNMNVSYMVQKAQLMQLVPIVPAESELEEAESLRHMCEPSDTILLENLAIEFLITQVFFLLAQSEIAEQTARVNAMKAASGNASDLLKELTLSYNKARQVAITTEIIEIASVAEALKGDYS